MKRRSRVSIQDRLVGFAAYFGVCLVSLMVLYPFIYIISVSLSRSEYVMAGMVKLFPVGFNLSAYQVALKEPLIGSGYRNTLIYASVGTALMLLTTVITAYPLAIKDFHGKKFFIVYMAVTMYFSGGLIPYFC